MKIFTIISFLLISMAVKAQDESQIRKLYGSFIVNKQLFNYEFTSNPKAGSGGFSFLLIPLDNKNNLMNALKNRKEDLIDIRNSTPQLTKFDESKLLGRSIDDLEKKYNVLKDSLESIKLKYLTENKKSNNDSLSNTINYINNIEREQKALEEYSKDLASILSKKTIEVKKQILGKYNEGNQKSKLSIVNAIIAKIESSKKSLNSIDDIKSFDETLKIQNLDVLKRSLDSIIDNNKTYIIKFKDFSTNLATLIQKLELYNSSIYDGQPTSFNEYNLNVFKGIFELQLKNADSALWNELLNLARGKGSADNALEETAEKIFYEIKTRLAFEGIQPVAGIIMLKNRWVDVRDDKNTKIRILEIKFVDIEFDDGTIKNIEVLLKSDDGLANSFQTPIRFRNNKPIGISGKFHPDKLMNHVLFAENYPSEGKSSSIVLGEFLAYFPQLNNNTESYAPENTIVHLEPSVAKTFEVLRKETTSKIIDLRVFTDLSGLQEKQPNGLVQTEISRKIDINTFHWQWGNYTNWSIFRYIQPIGAITKIDSKDDFLETDSKEVSPISFYQHQIWRLGVDLNLFKLNIPNIQLNIQGNINYTLIGSRVGKPDTNNTKREQVYSSIFRPGVIIEFKPEGRWGIFSRFDFWTAYDILNDNYKFNSENTSIKTLTLEAFIKTNINSKFYFRATHNWTDKTKNFNQIQFGIQKTINSYIDKN